MARSAKPFLVVATPCYGGVVTNAYMLSLLRLTQLAGQGGFDFDIAMVAGDSLISRARSILVARFLDNPRATHLFFIDADISFDCEQALRLLRFDKDFVAGQYPVKQIDWRALPARVVRGEPLDAAGLTYVGALDPLSERRVEDGFATARYAGTGFQLLKRAVLERMIAGHPELKYRKVDTLTNETPSPDHLCALFDTMIDSENGTYLSEDYSFCRRWRALGGEIWLDLESKLSHTGPQRFDGDCASRNALTTPPAQNFAPQFEGRCSPKTTQPETVMEKTAFALDSAAPINASS